MPSGDFHLIPPLGNILPKLTTRQLVVATYSESGLQIVLQPLYDLPKFIATFIAPPKALEKFKFNFHWPLAGVSL